jgi:hypothetical protein
LRALLHEAAFERRRRHFRYGQSTHLPQSFLLWHLRDETRPQ